MKKRIFSLLLAVTLAVGLLPTGALAAGEPVSPSSQSQTVTAVTIVAEVPAGGSETAMTWDAFAAKATAALAANSQTSYQVTLTADVTAAKPLAGFKGTLEGNGHKITLAAAQPAEGQTTAPAQYLFSNIAGGSTIRNLEVVGGGICSTAAGVTLENCKSALGLPADAAVTAPSAPVTTPDADTGAQGGASSEPPAVDAGTETDEPEGGSDETGKPEDTDKNAGAASLDPVFMFTGTDSSTDASCTAGNSVYVMAAGAAADSSSVTVYRSDTNAEVASAALSRSAAQIELKTGEGTALPASAAPYLLTAKVDGTAIGSGLKLTVNPAPGSTVTAVEDDSEPAETNTPPSTTPRTARTLTITSEKSITLKQNEPTTITVSGSETGTIVAKADDVNQTEVGRAPISDATASITMQISAEDLAVKAEAYTITVNYESPTADEIGDSFQLTVTASDSGNVPDPPPEYGEITLENSILSCKANAGTATVNITGGTNGKKVAVYQDAKMVSDEQTISNETATLTIDLSKLTQPSSRTTSQQYSLQVRYTEKATDTSSPVATLTLTVETETVPVVKPTAAISAGPYTADKDITVTVTGVKTIKKVQIFNEGSSNALQSADNSSGQDSVTLTFKLTAGSYKLTVKCDDAALDNIFSVTVNAAPEQAVVGTVAFGTGLGNNPELGYGQDLVIQVTDVKQGNAVVDSGTVEVRCGSGADSVSVSSRSDVKGGAATLKFNTEQTALIPGRDSTSSSRTLKVLYYPANSSTGKQIGSDLTLTIRLIPLANVEATVSAPNTATGMVTISAPTGYKICSDIYSATPEWGTSILSRGQAAQTSASYYLREDTEASAISEAKSATIPVYNPGTKVDLSTVPLTFGQLIYNGQPQPPVIMAQGYSTLTESLDYRVEYLTNREHTYAGTIDIRLIGLGLFDGSFVETSYDIEQLELKPFLIETGTITKVYDRGTSYDGTGLTLELRNNGQDGIIEADKGKFEVTAQYNYMSSEVGTKIGMKASNIQLISSDSEDIANNYYIGNNAEAILRNVGEITPRELEIDSATILPKTYDGTTAGTVAGVTFKNLLDSAAPVIGTDFNANAEFTDANVRVKAGTDGDSTEFDEINATVTVSMVNKNYTLADPTTTASAKITPATPEIKEWPTATAIDYGKTLNDSALNGGKALSVFSTTAKEEALAGDFKWKDPTVKPDAGKTKQKVVFIPTDPANTTNYTTAEGEVEVEVKQTPLTIDTAPTATPIKWGQSLSDSKFNGGKVVPDVEGHWEWYTDAETPVIDKATNYAYQAYFVPNNSNYESSEKVNVTLTVEQADPKITISAGENGFVKSGTTISVSAMAQNPYDPTLADAPSTQEITLTYKIGSGEDQRLTNGGKIVIPEDTPDKTKVVITAKTAEKTNFYNAGTAVLELEVTQRTILTVKPTPNKKAVIYDGSGHDGFSALKFIDTSGDEETEVKNLVRDRDYTVTWYSGNQLMTEAPVHAGTYTVVVKVDSTAYAGGTSTEEPFEFTIGKRTLRWKDTLSAIKSSGRTSEVSVTGTLGIANLVSGDKVKVPDDLTLVTKGFADKTEVGTYNDVVAVLTEDREWSEVLPTLSDYLWPDTDPSVDARVIAAVTQTGPTGEKLCVDIGGLVLAESLTKLDPPIKTTAELRSALRAILSSKFRTQKQADDRIAYYDLDLMIEKEDGSLVKATPENFPADGKLTVTIPYPRTSNSKCTFEVVHMFTEGNHVGEWEKIEDSQIEKQTDGIRFTVTGLSPIVVAWSTTSTNTSAGEIGGSNNGSTKPPTSSSNDDEEEYRVRVYSSTGGKVTANVRYAEADDTVRLTVTPNSGYSLSELTVTDKRGRNVRVRRSNGRYVFTMPERDVEVEATFTPIFSQTTLPTITTPTTTNTNTTLGTTCSYGSACPSRVYYDLNTSMWYHQPVDFVIARGLMTGLPDGQFAPYSNLSRAMIVQILYTQAGKPTGSGSAGFADVDSGAWYESAVNWAVAQGIAQGIGNRQFAPNASVTREQLALMLYNYATHRGVSLSTSQAAVTFNDNTRISQWAAPAVSAMQRAGIISGKSGNMFEPKGTATRVEAAQMLWNMLGR